jgi:hypothetical protein
MKAKLTVASLALLFLVFGVAAGPRPDFSGTWQMDKSRSLGIPPDMEQTLTVVQTAEAIQLEIKVVTAKGERVIKDTYVLDGKEADFTPQGLTGPVTGKGKRRAYWLPNDVAIAIEEVTTIDGQKGPETTQRTRKWRILNNGTTLTIDNYVDGPNGSGQARHTFLKK